jgi:hypothetical protein
MLKNVSFKVEKTERLKMSSNKKEDILKYTKMSQKSSTANNYSWK